MFWGESIVQEPCEKSLYPYGINHGFIIAEV